MKKVGFAVFGRPIQHEFKANGLFHDLNIGEQTYLELPGRGELKPGDNLAIIFRENIGESEIIKIFSYEYAISYNNRAGGFIGSGIAFTGNPSSKLLFSAYKATYLEALKLLTAGKKFKADRFNLSAITLIEPTIEGLVGIKPTPKNNHIKIGSSLGIRIDGPIQNSLMSVVQGFMYNPTFKTTEKLYVSANQQLLIDCLGNDKIYTLHNLLDFSKLFKTYAERLNKQKQDYEETSLKIRNLEGRIEEKNFELKSLYSKLEENKVKESDYISRLNKLEDNLRIEETKIRQKQSELNDLTVKIETINREHSNSMYKSFENIINDRRFKEAREKYETQFKKEISHIEYENNTLRKSLVEQKNRPAISKEVAIFFSLFLIILVLGSGFIGYKLKGSKDMPVKGASSNTTGSVANETNKDEKRPAINGPAEHSIDAFLSLSPVEIDSHKRSLDTFIDSVQNANADSIDLSNFFGRKWNFAEIIDYDKASIDAGLKRLKRIKEIHTAHGKEITFFDKYFMLDKFNDYSLEEYEFSTSKRNEIIRKYLDIPDNIYSAQDIANNFTGNIEETAPLLYMHFRWMLYMNSQYSDASGKTKDADILKTNRTRHVVPLKK